MGPDYLSIIFGFGTFALFIVLHILSFRFVEAKQVLRFLMIIYLFCLFLSFAICMAFNSSQIIIFSFIIYSSLVFIYVIGVFGLVESSIRIRLLDLIAHEGKKGIGRRAILKVYNRRIIVRKRLLRLCSSGELIYEKGCFRKKKNVSFVYIPYYLTGIMFYVY